MGPTSDDMPDQLERAVEPPPGSMGAARDARTMGLCMVCDRFVERTADGSCAAGHPAGLVYGSVVVAPGEPTPRMPPFNLAAFLIPPVWGLWYRQWFGLFFLALWFLALRAVELSVGKGIGFETVAALIVLGTLAFQFFFGRRGNALAWRRMCGRQTLAHFIRDQRWWAIGSMVVVVGSGVWLAIRLTGGLG
jgi:hypothetical protein